MLSRKHFDEHTSIPHTRANHNLQCLTRVFEALGHAQCKQKFPCDAMHAFGFLQTLLCESSNKEPLLHSMNMQKQMLFVQHSRNALNFLFDTQPAMQSVPVTKAGVRKGNCLYRRNRTPTSVRAWTTARTVKHTYTNAPPERHFSIAPCPCICKAYKAHPLFLSPHAVQKSLFCAIHHHAIPVILPGALLFVSNCLTLVSLTPANEDERCRGRGGKTTGVCD